MRILIYGINYSPELTGIGKYTGEMAAWFANQKHSVKVVTAPPYYPKWQVSEEFRTKKYSYSNEDGIEVVRCPLYVPSKVTTGRRLVHLLSFSMSSALPLLGCFTWKPDIVIQVVPSLFCSLQTLLLCRLTGSTSIVHIQDYEVDAMFGLSMVKRGYIMKLVKWVERKILSGFDYVSTISGAMIERAWDKGVEPDKVIFLPNWSELSRFRNVRPSMQLLTELGVDSGKKIILYSGNLGEKQGLETVIWAAKELKLNEDIHFLIVGDGAAKLELKSLANSLLLTNITFSPLVSSDQLPGLLASADCHLVVQKSGVADSVMPSKLTNILAVGGNAIVTANEDTALGNLCLKYKGIATLVAPDSISALVEGIKLSLTMPKPNQTATRYAEHNLNKDLILSRFLANITDGYLKN